MKILMLTPFIPYPPISGGRIRKWQQIRYLSSRHDLTLVTYAFSEKEYAFREPLKDFGFHSILVKHPNKTLPTGCNDYDSLPWPVKMFCTGEMHRTLETLMSQHFDIVLIEFIFMAHYGALFNTCTVLSEHNIESDIFRQYAELPNVSEKAIFGIQKPRTFWSATGMFMERYEDRTWPRFPLRITVSTDDREEMERRCRAGKTIVIENGVDTRSITPVNRNSSKRILFMGTMSYYPNEDGALYMAKTIMPIIWQRDPTITLCIAGLNPPPSIRDLASDRRIEVLANPDNMREVAERCSLSVVPLRLGGGTRLKILDSFAMGVPVVSTALGCKGLTVHDGEQLLIRDLPEHFADAVIRITSNPALADRLQSHGRRLVEERYDWQAIFEPLEQELVFMYETSALQTRGVPG